MKAALCVMGLVVSSALPMLGVASCVSPGRGYINLGVANYTGYAVTVDLSKSAPDYHDSTHADTFTIPATQGQNVVWTNHAVAVRTCYEPSGVTESGEGTITFDLPQADIGMPLSASGKRVLGDVKIPLTYAASFDSNRNSSYPQFTDINLNNNIADEVNPSSSPISGIAQFMHAKDSNIALLEVVLYQTAPGPGGNQNVGRPFQIGQSTP